MQATAIKKWWILTTKDFNSDSRFPDTLDSSQKRNTQFFDN